LLDTPSPSHSIMVVEDFDDNRKFIALSLRQLGYNVVEATNGQEAIEMAARECPSLILMDLTLPMLDGLSAAYRMREIDALCDVPIIACSAHSAAIHREAALAIGCDDYISKPFEIEKLQEMISRLLSRPRKDSRTGGRRKSSLNDAELLSHIDDLIQKVR
jgi:CheY-like chemotaxis protein